VADYVVLLLGTRVTFTFVPLLAYAVVCLALLLLDSEHFADLFAVRLGIYGGLLLALQYAVLVSLYISKGGAPLIGAVLGLCAAPPALAWAYRKARHRFGDKTTNVAALGLICVAIIVGGIAHLLSGGASLLVELALLLAGSPFWCLEIAGLVSFRLLRDYERRTHLSPWHVVGLLAWLGAYGVAWRLAVLRMLQAYAALPPTPPECYIASAAARGHPRLVRSRPAVAGDGRSFPLNRQTQRLKCAELAVQAAWPAGHRFLRRAYDALGPRLARRLRRPLLADAAYLLLKPLEWGSWAVLRAMLPQAGPLVGRLYTSGGED
jgi:hypothetical protein